MCYSAAEQGDVKLPWNSLKYLIGEVMYGGRAIDSFDRRILNTYMDEYMGDFIFDTFQVNLVLSSNPIISVITSTPIIKSHKLRFLYEKYRIFISSCRPGTIFILVWWWHICVTNGKLDLFCLCSPPQLSGCILFAPPPPPPEARAIF